VRSERHPSSTELYADGPHAATRQFEIGDADLGTERGVTTDLGLRFETDRASGEIRAFASRYDGYIYLSPTGEVADELPVYQYLQRDARFRGLELEAELPLGAGSGFTLGLTGDYVRGELEDGGNLPRIPPLRLGARLAWERGALGAGVGLERYFEQDEVTANELPTDAFTLLEADLRYRPQWGKADAVLFLRGSNLLDEDARVHSSPLRDELPLPGRSLTAGVRVGFGR
jgi:iron complex outermembrane receptor protein